MKFGLELEGTLFPLWRSYYVDYEGLKDLIEELRDNFPYMTLFQHHNVHIENDPSEPFKFLMNQVTFQFRDLDSSSSSSAKHHGTFRIVSVREREEDYQLRVQQEEIAAALEAFTQQVNMALLQQQQQQQQQGGGDSEEEDSVVEEYHDYNDDDESDEGEERRVREVGHTAAATTAAGNIKDQASTTNAIHDRSKNNNNNNINDRHAGRKGGGGDEEENTGHKSDAFQGAAHDTDDGEEEIIGVYDTNDNDNDNDNDDRKGLQGIFASASSQKAPLQQTTAADGFGLTQRTTTNNNDQGGTATTTTTSTTRDGGIVVSTNQPAAAMTAEKKEGVEKGSGGAAGAAEEEEVLDDEEDVDVALNGTFVFDLCSTNNAANKALQQKVAAKVAEFRQILAAGANSGGGGGGYDISNVNLANIASNPSFGSSKGLHQPLNLNSNTLRNFNNSFYFPSTALLTSRLAAGGANKKKKETEGGEEGDDAAAEGGDDNDPIASAMAAANLLEASFRGPQLGNLSSIDVKTLMMMATANNNNNNNNIPSAAAAGTATATAAADGNARAQQEEEEATSVFHQQQQQQQQPMHQQQQQAPVLLLPHHQQQPQGTSSGGGGGIAHCNIPPPTHHVEMFHIDPSNAALLRECNSTLPADPEGANGKKKKKNNKNKNNNKDGGDGKTDKKNKGGEDDKNSNNKKPSSNVFDWHKDEEQAVCRGEAPPPVVTFDSFGNNLIRHLTQEHHDEHHHSRTHSNTNNNNNNASAVKNTSSPSVSSLTSPTKRGGGRQPSTLLKRSANNSAIFDVTPSSASPPVAFSHSNEPFAANEHEMSTQSPPPHQSATAPPPRRSRTVNIKDGNDDGSGEPAASESQQQTQANLHSLFGSVRFSKAQFEQIMKGEEEQNAVGHKGGGDDGHKKRPPMTTENSVASFNDTTKINLDDPTMMSNGATAGDDGNENEKKKRDQADASADADASDAAASLEVAAEIFLDYVVANVLDVTTVGYADPRQANTLYEVGAAAEAEAEQKKRREEEKEAAARAAKMSSANQQQHRRTQSFATGTSAMLQPLHGEGIVVDPSRSDNGTIGGASSTTRPIALLQLQKNQNISLFGKKSKQQQQQWGQGGEGNISPQQQTLPSPAAVAVTPSSTTVHEDPFECISPLLGTNSTGGERRGGRRARSHSAIIFRRGGGGEGVGNEETIINNIFGGNDSMKKDNAGERDHHPTADAQSPLSYTAGVPPRRSRSAINTASSMSLDGLRHRRSNSVCLADVKMKSGGFGSVGPSHHQRSLSGGIFGRRQRDDELMSPIVTTNGGPPPQQQKPTTTAAAGTAARARKPSIVSLFPYVQQQRATNTAATQATHPQQETKHLSLADIDHMNANHRPSSYSDNRYLLHHHYLHEKDHHATVMSSPSAAATMGTAASPQHFDNTQTTVGSPRPTALLNGTAVTVTSNAVGTLRSVDGGRTTKTKDSTVVTTLLASRDQHMKRLQRIQQMQDLYSIRLTMHIYVNIKYFGRSYFTNTNIDNNNHNNNAQSASNSPAAEHHNKKKVEGGGEGESGASPASSHHRSHFHLPQFHLHHRFGGLITSSNDDDDVFDSAAEHSPFGPRYRNPAIAHALYAYQRSVSATISAALQIEIEKVSNFYLSQTHILCRSALLCVDGVKMWSKHTAKEREQLRTVYRQTYLTFRILQQFCDLNILAIGKFLKKVDKNTQQNSLENYRVAVEELNFRMGHDSRIVAVQKMMVYRLAKHAMNGSIKKAFNFLETTRDENSDFASGGGSLGGGGRLGKSKAWTLLSLAFFVGLVLSFGTMIILLLITTDGRGDLLFWSDRFSSQSAEYLILVPIIFAIPQFFFSINVMIYERFGINFAFMFELDPIFHFTGAELMRDSLIYIWAWMVCVYVFLRNNYSKLNCSSNDQLIRDDDNSPSVAVLWAIFPIFICIWLGIAAYNRFISVERRPFWSAEVFWRILTIPYYPVRFPDFFVLNYLTSMTTVLFELEWYWCTFTTNPLEQCSAGRSMSLCILNSLPNIWRMLQSVKRFYAQPKATRKPFPNLVNGGKYLTGVIQPFVWTAWAIARYYKADEEVLTFLYILSFFSQLLTQTYKYLWDVVVDAGIFIDYGGQGCGGYEWRKERVYKAWWPYYLFMVVDFVLRWRWLVTYYVQLHYRPAWFFAMWNIIELIRRSFWSAFRVENEHVNNTEHYRATKLAPIPVKNIHAWDTFASDASPEQFLSKKKRDQFSKEFPQIKGINLSSVTRFFACLPEEEKLKILVSSPLCSGYVPSEDKQNDDLDGYHDDHHPNGGGDASNLQTASQQSLQAHCPKEAAAAEALEETLHGNRIGLGTKYHGGPASNEEEEGGENNNNPSAQQQQHLPASRPQRQLSRFKGKLGEGKTRFFSELPEEHKILVIINHIGMETMNDFETRMKAELAEKIAKQKEISFSGGEVIVMDDDDRVVKKPSHAHSTQASLSTAGQGNSTSTASAEVAVVTAVQKPTKSNSTR